MSETNFGIAFPSIRENFFDPWEFCSDSQKLGKISRNFCLCYGTDFWRLSIKVWWMSALRNECTCKTAVILKSKPDKNFLKEILIQILLRSERIVFDLREFAKSLSILLKISLDLGSKLRLLRIVWNKFWYRFRVDPREFFSILENFAAKFSVFSYHLYMARSFRCCRVFSTRVHCKMVWMKTSQCTHVW